MDKGIPKPEYPRPQMVREEWMNLNGEWEFEFDDEDKGKEEEWFLNHSYSRRIQVPFAYQSKRSGIHITDFHDIVWYKREIESKELTPGKRYLLHFQAVDYQAELWVNGSYVGIHRGGHVSFTFEITPYLKEGNNVITLRVEDDSENLELPRGKQFWKETSENIFYTRTTGIWQTVWLEPVNDIYMERIRMTPDVDRKMIRMDIQLDKKAEAFLDVEISYGGKRMVCDTVSIFKGRTVREFKLDQNINKEWEHKFYEWTPDNPVLFDVKFSLKSGEVLQDEASSYFAMRKVSVENGRFLLNNRPCYQKMLLDQGYWRDSLMTAPDDEALIKDIMLCKEMGFNGARKHQKIEEERYFYWADKLGFLVWAEFPNAYIYSERYVENMIPEWIEAMTRDYNHPCIVAWVPLNESWGVDSIMCREEEQAHASSMYYLTKSLDTTRMVISNDGWNHTHSDLLTIHDYDCDGEVLRGRYASLDRILNDMPTNRTLFAKGHHYEGQPIIVSEFGGIAYKKNSDSGWGYANADSDEEFEEKYKEVVDSLLTSPLVQGFVYTQLCDVEQEINGLLTYDREPKLPMEKIRAINQGKK
ncbi:glycoside hydrolase family 2 protein [Kineothrix sp. MB12-C1]|uniref:glycoside hydrolase family 2 protein n=1 Tax=Kineothrix sp. MB12-C1 TaxID=3070215 RepID=UPI0027D251F4|nr:sugar-binding domain-containing protein [Kineothrix sp. MB12-C1]WMC91447.1 glycoside hydrolase family 2 TIM barrel-domain containing protein [Kineothrix sp. MB12-C1]